MDKDAAGYLESLDSRVWNVPATSSKIVRVGVNLEALRERFIEILRRSFVHACDLSNLYAGGDRGSQDCIDRGIEELSSLTVLLVYEYLRWNYRMFGEGSSEVIYDKPGPFPLEKSLPSGLCTLVEQFGYAESVEVHGNPRFLHVWDGEQKEGFGLAPEHSLDESVLHGFLQRLQLMNIPFRNVKKCGSRTKRTLWDSLVVEHLGNHTYSVSTSYPNENYNLPQDCFAAIFICGQSQLEAGTSVAFYAPRLSRFCGSVVSLQDIQSHEPTEATDAERDSMPAIALGDRATKVRVNGALQGVHLTGIQKRDDGDSVWMYGRGGIDDVQKMSKLSSPIRADQHWNACRDLLRKGDLPTSYLERDERWPNRFVPVPSTVVYVPINLNALRDRFVEIARAGFGGHTIYLDMDMDIDAEDAIKDHNDNVYRLATEATLAVRDRLCHLALERGDMSLLRRYGGIHPSHHVGRLPAGLCFLIEQFGYCETKSTAGSPEYVHCWDGEELTDTDNLHLSSLLKGSLRREGVPFCEINLKNAQHRSLWDSLHVKKVGWNFDVHTTFHSTNYVLPRDIFLSILLCGESSLERHRPVEFYAPRLAKYTRSVVVDDLGKHPPGCEGADDHVLLNGDLINMSVDGTQKQDKDSDAVCWIYGRGGAETAMKISSVGRQISEYECSNFMRTLMMKGPGNILNSQNA